MENKVTEGIYEDFIPVYVGLPDPHQQKAMVTEYMQKLSDLGYKAKEIEHGFLMEREAFEDFKSILAEQQS